MYVSFQYDRVVPESLQAKYPFPRTLEVPASLIDFNGDLTLTYLLFESKNDADPSVISESFEQCAARCSERPILSEADRPTFSALWGNRQINMPDCAASLRSSLRKYGLSPPLTTSLDVSMG